jgi:hypothetical protein
MYEDLADYFDPIFPMDFEVFYEPTYFLHSGFHFVVYFFYGQNGWFPRQIFSLE